MKLLLDANVVLDVLLDRKPHSVASSAVWNAAERKKCDAVLAAHCVTTIHYLVAKNSGSARAKRTIGLLLSVFGIATVDEKTIREALRLDWPDFEDAITTAAASSAGCDAIITRDLKGFAKSPIPILTPASASALFTD